jgi:asparagine synthase (glutamine-hydrolysing)
VGGEATITGNNLGTFGGEPKSAGSFILLLETFRVKENYMCGICGILAGFTHIIAPEKLKAMNEAASHRGPDDEGIVLFGSNGVVETTPGGSSQTDKDPGAWIAGLGHRRLAILDLTPSGHQPMSDPSGRYWIVLNGEIYNYLELRAELERLGHRFRSQTDTEVALASYISWGPEALSRFNGMWGMVIYDRVAQELFCARDRLGVKPLYLLQQPGVLAFASEIKQLLPLGMHPGTVNQKLLADLLLFGLETHTDDTFFDGIRALPEGCYMLADRTSIAAGNICPQRFWFPTPTRKLGEQEATECFQDLLADATRLRLRSDVPVGVTLSGGLDSSSLTCLASRLRLEQGGDPIRAFTVFYSDRGYSEKPFAEQVTKFCGAPPTYLSPEASSLQEDWKKFIWHMEEPFGGLSYYSNYKIYQLIRARGVPVILTGQGGDELLLGYDRYRVVKNLFQLRQGNFLDLFWEAYTTRKRANFGYLRQMAYLLYFAFPAIRIARRRFMVRPYLRDTFFYRHCHQTENLGIEIQKSPLEFQRSEIVRYQLPHLLRHEDRMSMASAIESRTPFLDYRLVEFVLGQGIESLIRNGWSKVILRDAMKGIMPETVRTRADKMGYNTPTGRLLQDNQSFLMDLLRRHLSDPFVQADSVAKAFEVGQIQENLLCSLLSYFSWKEQFGISN